MSNFFVYLYLVVFIIVDIAILIIGIEQLISFFIKKQAPEVPSSLKLRRAVVKQISQEMPNVKTIVDIGSGWGSMVRTISKAFPGAAVAGIEIMPMPYTYSQIRCLFLKNKKFFFKDAFKFLKETDQNFDIGITYLLTPEMKRVQDFLSKFKILIAVDFKLPDVVPTGKVKLHKDIFCQHWLYIYRN